MFRVSVRGALRRIDRRSIPPVSHSTDEAMLRAMAADELVLIRAGRFIDVLSGEVRARQVVLVRGDRVESVGEDDGSVPEGARVIDLSNATVLPGLMDMHAHLVGLEEDGQGYASLVMRSGAQEAFGGVRNARSTIRPASRPSATSARSERSSTWRCAMRSRPATCSGPRMMCAGRVRDVPGRRRRPHRARGRRRRGGPARAAVRRDDSGVDQMRSNVRNILRYGADFIKVIATGAVLTSGTNPGAPEFTEDELRAAVEEAALSGTHVAAHAHGAEGIKRAVRAGVRSIEHGSLMDDEAIELMAEHGTYLVADIYDGDWIAEEGPRMGYSDEVLRKNEETTDAQRDGFAKCVKAGVKIAYGTDSGVVSPRVERSAVRQTRASTADADGGHPGGDDRGRSELLGVGGGGGGGPRALRRPDRGGRRIRSRTSPLSRTSPFVMKGGEVVKGVTLSEVAARPDG